jgi:hypothetical protein
MLFLYPFHEIQSLNFSPFVFFLFQILKMAQSRLEKVGTIYSRMRGLLATGAVKPEQVCTLPCGSGPSDPELLLLVGSGTPCTAWIWNALYWSDLELLDPVHWSDPELFVLVGSGTPCSGRIWNALYWSDLERLVLVGSGTLCTGRIRNSLNWSDPEVFVLVGFRNTIPDPEHDWPSTMIAFALP